MTSRGKSHRRTAAPTEAVAVRRCDLPGDGPGNCYPISNNPLRHFVFFSYNFRYILPAAS